MPKQLWPLAAVLVQAIAFIVAIMAVCYSVVTTCVESRALDLEASLPEDDSELLPYRPEFFHAVFGLASAYLCMLYISWNLNTLPSLSGDGKFQVSCWTRFQHGPCLSMTWQNSVPVAACGRLTCGWM